MAVAVVEALDVRAVTTFIADVEPTYLSDDELARLVVDTERLLNAVHALSAVALEEFQRRGTWANDGALSAAGWAAGRSGSPARVLRARVRAGAGLRLLPAAAPSARSGRLSPQHLGALGGCARRHPELAARDETVLVEQAEALDGDGFTAAARHWQECADAVDAPDAAETPTPVPADELHLSRTFDGRYQLDGSFSADTGQLMWAALDGEVDRHLRAGRDGDPSVAPLASQVRAAALIDLVTQTMAGNRPSSRFPTATGLPWSSTPTSSTTYRWRAATRPPTGLCSALPARSSTWAASRKRGPPVSAGPSPSATVLAYLRAAADLRRGATFTIASHGTRAAGPASTTVHSCAEHTIHSSIRVSGSSTSTEVRPSSEDGTGRDT